MQRATIALDDEFVTELDRVIVQRGYQNRSEAIRDLARSGMRQAAEDTKVTGDCVAALVYVEYKNIHGIPYPYDRFPYVVLGWLALAVAIMLAFPRLVRRIGENLSRAEGIERPPPA